jgi:hypothetical protein
MAIQQSRFNNRRLTITIPIALCLVGNLFPAATFGATSIPAPANKGDLQLEGYSKLTSGAGPTTNDVTVTDSAAVGAPPASVNLQPLKLGNETPTSDNSTPAAATAGGEDVLKSTVTTTDYAAKPQDTAVLQDTSVVGKNKPKHSGKHVAKTLRQQADDVHIAPIPLQVSEGDQKKEAAFLDDTEKQQLSDLWEATLTRSPDIQFVVAKLQPTNSNAHLNTILSSMLSTAAYGGMSAVMMMSPGMGTYAAGSAGSMLISNVLQINNSRQQKKQKLSQEEEMIMFNMVRGTADKLVAAYRDYKKRFVSLSRASSDLQDLQAMAADARAGQDASKQLEMDYVLRKQQRDIDEISDDVRRYRQTLLDLAGPDSVAKLDKQIIWEQTQIDGQPSQDIAQKPAETATPKADDTAKPSDASADKKQTAESKPTTVTN